MERVPEELVKTINELGLQNKSWGNISRLKRDLMLVVKGHQGYAQVNDSWAAALIQELDIMQLTNDRLTEKLKNIKEIASD